MESGQVAATPSTAARATSSTCRRGPSIGSSTPATKRATSSWSGPGPARPWSTWTARPTNPSRDGGPDASTGGGRRRSRPAGRHEAAASGNGQRPAVDGRLRQARLGRREDGFGRLPGLVRSAGRRGGGLDRQRGRRGEFRCGGRTGGLDRRCGGRRARSRRAQATRAPSRREAGCSAHREADCSVPRGPGCRPAGAQSCCDGPTRSRRPSMRPSGTAPSGPSRCTAPASRAPRRQGRRGRQPNGDDCRARTHGDFAQHEEPPRSTTRAGDAPT